MRFTTDYCREVHDISRLLCHEINYTDSLHMEHAGAERKEA